MANHLLFFSALDAVHGRELWRSDGTVALLASDIAIGADSSSPADMIVVGNDLVFTADTTRTGRELWEYDQHTTTLIKDIRPWPGKLDDPKN